MKLKPCLAAALAAAIAFASLSALVRAQTTTATILPLGKQCFQATTGVNGMVGTIGTITGGSAYVTGTYGGVPLTGGSGSGATANITVAGGAVTVVTVLNPGTQYVVGDVLSASAASIGGAGSGFSFSVSSTSINSSLAGGSVGYYVPTTLTTKQTWQNSGETVLNSNPVPLDANGCAIVYGNGIYRQIVKDSLGNTVWDALTASTGSGGGGGGTTVGDGNIVGTILPWSGLIAPPNYIFAYGQPISRATYPLFFNTVTISTNIVCSSGINVLSGIADTQNIRIGAPVEASCVAPGTVVTVVNPASVTISNNATTSTSVVATFFPFGDGDGATTFNAPDLRGLVPMGRNNMGGVASSHMSSTANYPSPNSVGGIGGSQGQQLFTANLPPYTPAGTITNGAISAPVSGGVLGGTAVSNAVAGAGIAALIGSTGIVVTPSQAPSIFTGTPQGGTSAVFPTTQPSVALNYIVKVLPDASTVVASGVASLGGMTGVIACGAGLNCNANTISSNANIAANISFAQNGASAVSATFDQLYRGQIYSPVMWGAVCSPNGTAVGSLVNTKNQLQNAINDIGTAGGGNLILGPCAYGVGNGLAVTNSRVYLQGAGPNATWLVSQPTVPTSTIAFGNAGIIDNCGLRDMSVGSADQTLTKNGITVIDSTQCSFTNFVVSNYPQGTGILTGAGGAVAFQTQGRELGLVLNAQLYAQTPLQISCNPHGGCGSEDLDSWTFSDLTLIGELAAPTHHCVLIDSGVGLFNTRLIGHENWIGCLDGLHWIDGGSTAASMGLTIAGLKVEQGNDPTGYSVNIQTHSGLWGLKIVDGIGGDRRGIKLRTIVDATIDNFTYTSASLEGLNVDSTVQNLKISGSVWTTGTTATISGLNPCHTSASPAGTSTAIPPNAVYSSTACLETFGPVLHKGTFAVAGLSSGTGTATAPNALGSAAWTWPTNSGTFAVSASAPLVENATTGNLTCPSCVLVSATPHGDSAYNILSTDRYVFTNATFTAPRIWTLPAANSLASGTTIWVQDAQNTVTSTNTLTVARAGADTINIGSTSLLITGAAGGITFTTDGVSNWGVPVQTVSTGGTAQKTLTANAFLTGNGTSPINQVAITGLVLGAGASAPAAYAGTSCTNQFVTALSASGVSTCASTVVRIVSQSFCPSGCTTTIAGGGSGTYTPTTGTLYAKVRMVGGGGGGGSSAGTATNIYGGAGGSAGTYTESVLSAATIGASKAIVIGAAGAGGAAGSNPGAAAGTTSLGSTIVTAPGGPGGSFGSSINIPTSGAAAASGTFATGGFTVPGGQGTFGAYYQIITVIPPSGAGASSIFGTGGSGVAGNSSAVAGNAGTGFGSGGSGGISHNTASNAAGATGATGAVFIDDYVAQ
jgi:hypothetical protein